MTPEKWTCWANPAVAFHAVIPIQVVAITSAYGYVQVNQAGARKQVNASQKLMYRCIEGDVRPRSSRELRSWGKQKWNIGLIQVTMKRFVTLSEDSTRQRAYGRDSDPAKALHETQSLPRPIP